MNTRLLKLNEFYLRIIAIITMTLDHIGVFLLMYIDQMGGIEVGNEFSNPVYTVAFIFRCIGRIAMPLYIFMIVEGVRHTRHFGKYILRLGIVASVIAIAQIIIYYFFDTSIAYDLSPFTDLLLVALMVYLLKRKDNLKYLAFLPMAYLIMCYVIDVYENAANVAITWLPFYLKAGYSLFALILGLGFYFANVLAFNTLSKQSGIDNKEIIEGYPEYRALTNVLDCITIAIAGLLIFASAYIKVDGRAIFDVYGANVQSYCFIAIIPLYFYNGLRGYNKAWFKWANYLYYPVHIVILFAIFYLIFR